MGGLMSIYALAEYGHVFSKGAALSPSLWTAPEKVSRMLSNAAFLPGTVLYMDYGTEELKYREAILKQFGEVSRILMEQKVLLNCRIVPGGMHCEASWERQIPFFMETLLYDL